MTGTKAQYTEEDRELTVPSTLKNNEGISLPIVVVDTENTPSGKVNPHHPILNGNLLWLMLATANNSHKIPYAHITNATIHPRV